MASPPRSWDTESDVVCVGSGLAGCSAAIASKDAGLDVMLLEKSDKLGGGTAYSLGIVWVGNNHLAREMDIADSREETLEYVRFLGGGYEDEAVLTRFVDSGPEAVRYFAERIGIPFYVAPGLPDHYYTRAPGSKEQGRSLLTRPFPARSLGQWYPHLRASPYQVHRATFEEMRAWGGRANVRNWDSGLIQRRSEEDVRTFGGGLAGHFVQRVLGQGVRVHLGTGVRELVTDDGAVVGVVGESNGRHYYVRARRGVVLATGGYEANKRLMGRLDEFCDEPCKFPPSVAGDGLVVATEIGAALGSVPFFQVMLSFHIPGETHDGAPFYREAGINELAFPHAIVVNEEGRRFADESYYGSVMMGLREYDLWKHKHRNIPAFLVFDQTYLDKYPFADIKPGSPAPDWLPQAETLRDLANKLRVEPDGLEATVKRFNRLAEAGRDEDFGRGQLPWVNAVTGDFSNKPNPNLGPLVKPPFYGLRLAPSASGSHGLIINEDAQVIHVRGMPIQGLYACGAASEHFYGIGYQAGYQLAGGMVFGYRAAQHARERQR